MKRGMQLMLLAVLVMILIRFCITAAFHLVFG